VPGDGVGEVIGVRLDVDDDDGRARVVPDDVVERPRQSVVRDVVLNLLPSLLCSRQCHPLLVWAQTESP
jgi:hypothetical protein